jgi:hypothetical protein
VLFSAACYKFIIDYSQFKQGLTEMLADLKNSCSALSQKMDRITGKERLLKRDATVLALLSEQDISQRCKKQSRAVRTDPGLQSLGANIR